MPICLPQSTDDSVMYSMKLVLLLHSKNPNKALPKLQRISKTKMMMMS